MDDHASTLQISKDKLTASWQLPSAFSSTKNKQVPENNHFGARFQHRGERRGKSKSKGVPRARPQHLQQSHQTKKNKTKSDYNTNTIKGTGKVHQTSQDLTTFSSVSTTPK